MSDENIPPVEPGDDAAPPAETPDETPAAKECALCGAPAPKENRAFVNRKIVCLECRDKIEDELKAEQAGAVSTPPAIAGALVGAIIGAVVWAGILVVTEYEVGYVALLVGWLAGKGAVLGAGGKKGMPLQITAVLAAVVGLLLGKYFTLAHYAHTEMDWSYFDGRIFEYFTDNLGDFFSGFDILWLVLAIGVAFRVPAPTQVSMSRRKSG